MALADLALHPFANRPRHTDQIQRHRDEAVSRRIFEGEGLRVEFLGDAFARFFSGAITELAIDVPMRPERQPAQTAYDLGSAAIAGHLRAGRDVVMLCEGDPFFYGSFMYIFARLAKDYHTVVVPGITSITEIPSSRK